MKDSIRMTKSMVLEYTPGLMVENMLVSGLIARGKGMGKLYQLMGLNVREFGRTIVEFAGSILLQTQK